ncbi:hypothetical protein N657DRAFT_681734 [Parathielavia appendiculata]|uniref:Uncharacterized protein n=1 Tax=Parathielavia appendiculata TaxID=2587402 RepID=A0AAN6TXX2_9PEZI|nr:hypothetical protein N657DRAFT_681734 [Parathielavia appendiculata]
MAQGLNLAMQLENQAQVPIGIPNALRATFHPTIPNPLPETRKGQQAIAGSRPVQDASSRPMLEPGQSTESTLAPLRTTHALEHPVMRGLEDLSMVSSLAPSTTPHHFPPVPIRPQKHESDQESESLMISATLLNSTKPGDGTVRSESAQSALQESHQQDQQGYHPVGASAGKPEVDEAVLKAQDSMTRADENTLLLLQWVGSIGIQLLILIAGVLQIPAGIKAKDSGLAADGNGEMVKTKQPARLRLAVPWQESRRDYDGETCVGSSGLAPGTAFSVPGKAKAVGESAAGRQRQSEKEDEAEFEGVR